jgi:phosphoribosylamine-glycine ligase
MSSHSGTALAGDQRIVTAGGRVLTVVGTAANLPGTRSTALSRRFQR